MRPLSFLKIFITLCCCFCIATQSFASPTTFSTGFTYYAKQQDLSVVLTQFARFYGYSAFLSPEVIGNMSGRFDKVDAHEFLGGIRSAFGVSWYNIDQTLFFYHESENTRAFISPRAMTAERMFTMLRTSGVFSLQLMPNMDNSDDMIIVTGPQTYINQINLAANSFENAQTSNYVMKVFPIKYAWADDMTITSLDQTVTVPGVATILRSMVLGSTNMAPKVVQQQATVESLNGKGLAAQGTQTMQAVTTQQVQNQPQTQSPTTVNIMADARVNAVIVNDAAYRMPYYEQVIADLDKPVELVEIHAAIVDIDSDYKRDLGITLQGSGGSGNIGVGGESSGSGESFSPLPTPGQPSGAGLSLSTIYTHGTDYFLARVEALEENGEARVLGRPSVLTVDNVQASLENTTTYYVKVEGKDTVDLFKVEAGTVLSVTPHIIRENGLTTIKLAVKVQDDQENQSSGTADVGALPPIKQTKINTQAIVGEGQSLLIGGYYYERQKEGESGVPLLKDIPLLGYLFKTKSEQSQRMERLILITPRVIQHTAPPEVPSHIDDPSFHRSPTQNTYEPRIPEVSNGGGCSRKTTPPKDPSQAAQG